MAGWGCPHEDEGWCRRLNRDCEPGIPGCVLRGRVHFADSPDKDPTPAEVQRAEVRISKHRPVPPGRPRAEAT